MLLLQVIKVFIVFIILLQPKLLKGKLVLKKHCRVFQSQVYDIFLQILPIGPQSKDHKFHIF
jgi:hypothetical protein